MSRSWLIPFTTSQIKYSSLLSNGKSEGHFRSTVWDPFLIIFQIISLQCIYYASLSFWLCIIGLIVGTSRSLDYIFKYQEIHIREHHGKLLIATFLLNAVVGAFALWMLIQRMKLCLDFSSTIHFLHLLVCWYYNGRFPVNVSWWLLNIACLAITCSYGEFLCMQTELKSIPLKMSQKIDL